jgi:hypothetical protein
VGYASGAILRPEQDHAAGRAAVLERCRGDARVDLNAGEVSRRREVVEARRGKGDAVKVELEGTVAVDVEAMAPGSETRLVSVTMPSMAPDSGRGWACANAAAATRHSPTNVARRV